MNATTNDNPMSPMPIGDMPLMESNALMDRREQVLSIVPHISGALSMLGSLLIACRILRRYKTKERLQTYHFLMLSMTSVDFVSSFAFAFGGTASPPGLGPGFRPRYRAHGTEQTCTAQGFFIQLGIIVAFLNLLLSLHYLAVIRYQLREERLRKWMIPGLVLVFVIGLSLSVPLIFMDGYAPTALWCWIGPKFQDCFAAGMSPEECVDRVVLLTNVMYYVPLWLCVGLATIVQVVVFWSVRSVDAKANKWRFRNVQTEKKAKAKTSKRRQRRFSSSRKVAIQSVLYLSCFYIAWTPNLVATNVIAIDNKDAVKMASILEGKYFWLILFSAILQPLQGFLNCLVYFRKTIVDWMCPKVALAYSKCSLCSCKRRNIEEHAPVDPEYASGSNNDPEEVGKEEVGRFAGIARNTSVSSGLSSDDGNLQELPSDMYNE